MKEENGKKEGVIMLRKEDGFDYKMFFEKERRYPCKIVSYKKNSCQLRVAGVAVQVLGIACNFIFPRRPVFSEINNWEGTCKVNLGRNGDGLIAEEVVLIPPSKEKEGE